MILLQWQLAGSVKLFQLWAARSCDTLLMVSCDWRFEGLECGQGLYGHYKYEMLSAWMTGSQMITITLCFPRRSSMNALHLLYGSLMAFIAHAKYGKSNLGVSIITSGETSILCIE